MIMMWVTVKINVLILCPLDDSMSLEGSNINYQLKTSSIYKQFQKRILQNSERQTDEFGSSWNCNAQNYLCKFEKNEIM